MDPKELEELEQQAFAIIKGIATEPVNNFYTLWVGFFYAVDWSETWLQCLLLSYVMLLFCVIYFREKHSVQYVIFLAIGFIVYLSETFNTFANKNWTEFAKQNYFDDHGIFTTTIFCFPLLIIMIVQLVSLCLFPNISISPIFLM
jgi:hypothetical protein